MVARPRAGLRARHPDACTTTLGEDLEEKILAVSEWSYLLHEYSRDFEPRGSIYVEHVGKTQLAADLRRASAALTAALWTPFGSTERDIADALTLDGWWGTPEELLATVAAIASDPALAVPGQDVGSGEPS